MEINFVENVSMKEILIEIGFVPVGSNLEFDFGNCKLECVEVLFPGGLYFTGYYVNARTAQLFDFQLPLKVESFEQGVAVLVFNMKSADFKIFPEWFAKGLLWQDELPWRKKSAKQVEYENIPKAWLDPDWFKLIVKKLISIAKYSNDLDVTTFSFDDSIIKIVSNNELLVAPASGKSWIQSASVLTKALDLLPKRIYKESGCIYIQKNNLVLTNASNYCRIELMQDEKADLQKQLT